MMEDIGYYYSYLEVDLQQGKKNFLNMQQAIPQTIIPVIKGNAHGFGTVPVARMFVEDLGIKTVACAQVCEAAEMRKAGFDDVDIMLLSGVPRHALEAVVDYRLLMPLYDVETVQQLSRIVGEKGIASFPVQVKVDLGLHRIGVAPQQLDTLLAAIRQAGNLELTGFYGHFSNAGTQPDPITQRQYELYCRLLEQVRGAGFALRYTHVGCSASVAWLQADVCSHTRIGWGYLAYTPLEGFASYFGNRPAVSLRAFITAIHHVEPGDTVGYGMDVVAQRPMKTATLSMGFCDGFYRPLALHGGYALLRGKEARYLSICMDQTFLDVTDIDCQVGDEVTIYGQDKYSPRYLTTAEAAQFADGNSSSLHTYINGRVARIYKK